MDFTPGHQLFLLTVARVLRSQLQQREAVGQLSGADRYDLQALRVVLRDYEPSGMEITAWRGLGEP